MARALSGRVAFVTLPGEPAGDGRAEALARALVGEGALVVLVAPDPDTGGRVAGAVGSRAVFCPGDDVDADVGALVELAAELSRTVG